MAYSPNGKDGQPLNNEEHNKDAETNGDPNSSKVVNLSALTINVFFDGTGNNKFNTEFRLEDEKSANKAREEARLAGKSIAEQNKAAEKAKKNKALKNEISYGNDLSNVALLYEAAKDNLKTVIKVYIPGAGTINEKPDHRGGLAAATGESGIMDRVYDAFKQINEKISIIKPKPTHLTFNVYGFSRGSFYGRFFCALLKKDPKTDPTADHYPSIAKTIYDYTLGTLPVFNNTIPFSKGIPINTNDRSFRPTGRALLSFPPKNIRINFVGIYDTVASHGWDHANDSEYFELDIGPKQQIAKIVHITAQNEYRNHFALVETNAALTWRNPSTNKNSLLGEPIGFQCSVPGAHADIGGGYIKNYHDGGDDKDLYLSNYDPPTQWGIAQDKGEIYWQWYVKKGYYSTNPNKYYGIRAKQSAYKNQQDLLIKAKQDQNEMAVEINEKAVKTTQQEMEAAIKTTPETYLLPRQETTQGELSVVKKRGGYYEVRANRVVKGNAYQYIPLKLMQTLAENKGVPKFDHPTGLPELHKVYAEVNADPVLAKFNRYVISQGLKQYKTEALFDFHPINADLTEEESQYLYHEYIHASLQAELRYMPGDYFGKYVTNGSNNYNKNIETFEPMRVTILGYVDGVANQRHNERLQADKERAKQEANRHDKPL